MIPASQDTIILRQLAALIVPAPNSQHPFSAQNQANVPALMVWEVPHVMSVFLNTTIYPLVAALHVIASLWEFAVAPMYVIPSPVCAPVLEMRLTETAQSALLGISTLRTETHVSSVCAQVEVMCVVTALVPIKWLQCSLISHSSVHRTP